MLFNMVAQDAEQIRAIRYSESRVITAQRLRYGQCGLGPKRYRPRNRQASLSVWYVSTKVSTIGKNRFSRGVTIRRRLGACCLAYDWGARIRLERLEPFYYCTYRPMLQSTPKNEVINVGFFAHTSCTIRGSSAEKLVTIYLIVLLYGVQYSGNRRPSPQEHLEA